MYIQNFTLHLVILFEFLIGLESKSLLNKRQASLCSLVRCQNGIVTFLTHIKFNLKIFIKKKEEYVFLRIILPCVYVKQVFMVRFIELIRNVQIFLYQYAIILKNLKECIVNF